MDDRERGPGVFRKRRADVERDRIRVMAVAKAAVTALRIPTSARVTIASGGDLPFVLRP
jgi:hypothetical protein